MSSRFVVICTVVGIMVGTTSVAILPAMAADVIDEWASVKAPPAPILKPVIVEPKTTALLMLDFLKPNCGTRPRCIATIPAMKKLLGEARAAKATVIYSFFGKNTAADIVDNDLAPAAGEQSVTSFADTAPCLYSAWRLS